MRNAKTKTKIIIFLAILTVLFIGVMSLVRPVWMSDNHFNSTHGFYKEPKNTIETIFLGTSVVERGITPMELYENYGICAYNLASQNQPMMASYYWLEEAYRLQSETLDTVVLDMSTFRLENREDSSRYVKSLEGMRLSNVKLRFLRDYSNGIYEYLSYLIPVIAFHDRWKELTEEDFTKFITEPAMYLRGYDVKYNTGLESYDDYKDIAVPLYTIEDENAELTPYHENIEYFEKIEEFCDNNGIQLILIKTPQRGEHTWSDAAHNVVQELADQYGLEFLDFNYLPLFDELDFSFATDEYDNYHMNYNGASKMTNWMGAYLADKCNNRDVRGENAYAFMEGELANYQTEIVIVADEEIPDYEEELEEALNFGGPEELTGSLLELYQYNLLCLEIKNENMVDIDYDL